MFHHPYEPGDEVKLRQADGHYRYAIVLKVAEAVVYVQFKDDLSREWKAYTELAIAKEESR